MRVALANFDIMYRHFDGKKGMQGSPQGKAYVAACKARIARPGLLLHPSRHHATHSKDSYVMCKIGYPGTAAFLLMSGQALYVTPLLRPLLGLLSKDFVTSALRPVPLHFPLSSAWQNCHLRILYVAMQSRAACCPLR